ncbi:hypothetical protein CYMTET_16702, partial [Cymbomonas tetramitiformis]
VGLEPVPLMRSAPPLSPPVLPLRGDVAKAYSTLLTAAPPMSDPSAASTRALSSAEDYPARGRPRGRPRGRTGARGGVIRDMPPAAAPVMDSRSPSKIRGRGRARGKGGRTPSMARDSSTLDSPSMPPNDSLATSPVVGTARTPLPPAVPTASHGSLPTQRAESGAAVDMQAQPSHLPAHGVAPRDDLPLAGVSGFAGMGGKLASPMQPPPKFGAVVPAAASPHGAVLAGTLAESALEGLMGVVLSIDGTLALNGGGGASPQARQPQMHPSRAAAGDTLDAQEAAVAVAHDMEEGPEGAAANGSQAVPAELEQPVRFPVAGGQPSGSIPAARPPYTALVSQHLGVLSEASEQVGGGVAPGGRQPEQSWSELVASAVAPEDGEMEEAPMQAVAVAGSWGGAEPELATEQIKASTAPASVAHEAQCGANIEPSVAASTGEEEAEAHAAVGVEEAHTSQGAAGTAVISRGGAGQLSSYAEEAEAVGTPSQTGPGRMTWAEAEPVTAARDEEGATAPSITADIIPEEALRLGRSGEQSNVPQPGHGDEGKVTQSGARDNDAVAQSDRRINGDVAQSDWRNDGDVAQSEQRNGGDGDVAQSDRRNDGGVAQLEQRNDVDVAQSNKNDAVDSNQRDEGGVAQSNQRDEGGVAQSNQRDEGGVAQSNQRDEGGVAQSNQRDEGGVAQSNQRDEGDVAQSNQRGERGVAQSEEREEGDVANANETDEGDGALSNQRDEGEVAQLGQKNQGDTGHTCQKDKDAAAQSGPRQQGDAAQAGDGNTSGTVHAEGLPGRRTSTGARPWTMFYLPLEASDTAVGCTSRDLPPDAPAQSPWPDTVPPVAASEATDSMSSQTYVAEPTAVNGELRGTGVMPEPCKQNQRTVPLASPPGATAKGISRKVRGGPVRRKKWRLSQRSVMSVICGEYVRLKRLRDPKRPSRDQAVQITLERSADASAQLTQKRPLEVTGEGASCPLKRKRQSETVGTQGTEGTEGHPSQTPSSDIQDHGAGTAGEVGNLPQPAPRPTPPAWSDSAPTTSRGSSAPPSPLPGVSQACKRVLRTMQEGETALSGIGGDATVSQGEGDGRGTHGEKVPQGGAEDAGAARERAVGDPGAAGGGGWGAGSVGELAGPDVHPEALEGLRTDVDVAGMMEDSSHNYQLEWESLMQPSGATLPTAAEIGAPPAPVLPTIGEGGYDSSAGGYRNEIRTSQGGMHGTAETAGDAREIDMFEREVCGAMANLQDPVQPLAAGTCGEGVLVPEHSAAGLLVAGASSGGGQGNQVTQLAPRPGEGGQGMLPRAARGHGAMPPVGQHWSGAAVPLPLTLQEQREEQWRRKAKARLSAAVPGMFDLWGGDMPAVEGHTLVAKLGEGSYRAVFEALRHRTQAETLLGGGAEAVVLKFLSPLLSTSQVTTEVNALNRLRGCPNVVQLRYLLNLRRQGGGCVLAFPFVQGDDFRDFLRGASLQDVKRYLRALLTALKHTHSRGLVHRDIKPSNFLYCRASGEGCLIDFGSSKSETPPSATAPPAASHGPRKASSAAPRVVVAVEAAGGLRTQSGLHTSASMESAREGVAGERQPSGKGRKRGRASGGAVGSAHGRSKVPPPAPLPHGGGEGSGAALHELGGGWQPVAAGAAAAGGRAQVSDFAQEAERGVMAMGQAGGEGGADPKSSGGSKAAKAAGRRQPGSGKLAKQGAGEVAPKKRWVSKWGGASKPSRRQSGGGAGRSGVEPHAAAEEPMVLHGAESAADVGTWILPPVPPEEGALAGAALDLHGCMDGGFAEAIQEVMTEPYISQAPDAELPELFRANELTDLGGVGSAVTGATQPAPSSSLQSVWQELSVGDALGVIGNIGSLTLSPVKKRPGLREARNGSPSPERTATGTTGGVNTAALYGFSPKGPPRGNLGPSRLAQGTRRGLEDEVSSKSRSPSSHSPPQPERAIPRRPGRCKTVAGRALLTPTGCLATSSAHRQRAPAARGTPMPQWGLKRLRRGVPGSGQDSPERPGRHADDGTIGAVGGSPEACRGAESSSGMTPSEDSSQGDGGMHRAPWRQAKRNRRVLADTDTEGGSRDGRSCCTEDDADASGGARGGRGDSDGFAGGGDEWQSPEGDCTGTRGFRAPEVLLGVAGQTCAVDMWSVGVVMASLLTGRFPFFSTGQDDQAALTEIAILCGGEAIEQLAHSIGLNLRELPPLQVTHGNLSTGAAMWMRMAGGDRFLQSSEIPQKAWDLLQQCLEVDPAKRITAEAALRHSFLA